MKCIVHFINYFFYMPKNICLGIFDQVPNLCLWLDFVGVWQNDCECGAIVVELQRVLEHVH